MLAGTLAAIAFPFYLATSSINSYICQPPGVPTIVQPASDRELVGGQPITFSGDATSNSLVTLSANDSAFLTATADDSNTYTAVSTLPAGQYTLAIAVENPCGLNTGEAIDIVVGEPPVTPVDPTPQPAPQPTPAPNTPAQPTPGQSSTLPPNPPVTVNDLTLVVSSPRSGSVVDGSFVYVNGTLNQAGTVVITLNGERIASSSSAATFFGFNIPLATGLNTIVVTVTSGGNNVSQTILVTRTAPTASNEDTVDGPTEEVATPWYETPQGRVAITAVSILVILIIIGLLFL